MLQIGFKVENGNPYGLGWFMYGSKPNPEVVFGHAGGQTGASTQLLIVPSRKKVIVVLCNTSGVWDDVIGTAAHLNSVFKKDFPAPFVKESPVQIGLEFKEQIDIELNGTIMMIGEIQEIFIPDDCLSKDGFFDIEKAGSVTCSGLDAYHLTQRIARLSYAKPNEKIKEI